MTTDVRDGVPVTWPGVPTHVKAYILTKPVSILALWDEAANRHCGIRLDNITEDDVRLGVMTLERGCN